MTTFKYSMQSHIDILSLLYFRNYSFNQGNTEIIQLFLLQYFHWYSLEILQIIDDKHCSTWTYHETMAYYKIHDQSFSHTRVQASTFYLSIWWMMENFQIKHREKMVKGYITAETKSNALYALFFYFFGKLFNAIKRLLV